MRDCPPLPRIQGEAERLQPLEDVLEMARAPDRDLVPISDGGIGRFKLGDLHRVYGLRLRV